MKYSLELNAKKLEQTQVVVTTVFCKTTPAKGNAKEKKEPVLTHWSKEWKEAFTALKASREFTGEKGQQLTLTLPSGATLLIIGLGEKTDASFETLRRQFAEVYKLAAKRYKDMTIDLDGLILKNKPENSIQAVVEGLEMAAYRYDNHLSQKTNDKLSKVVLASVKTTKAKGKTWQKALNDSLATTESISVARDFVNEAPNVLHSEQYAKLLEKDAKTLPRVKTKVLTKAEIKKEKMGLLLSVNNGSAYEPRVTHFTYTPKKPTKNTKHIVLVGKGLTFDTGGYSLKPSSSMINMKFDMGGSATMYGAFRAAALLDADVKITCILGITDNAVNSKATMPDSVVKGRNGKTVEILNTDAEGRLVLADCLDYACDLKPDAIIDAATLTGACLVAVGHEVCAVMGNEKKLVDGLLKSADNTEERMWQLPIFDEYREDMKSPMADLKNIGSKPYAGSSKAAAFLEAFIKNDTKWAHLDIAGIATGQGHLPYCPSKGASGLIVRSVTDYLMSLK